MDYRSEANWFVHRNEWKSIDASSGSRKNITNPTNYDGAHFTLWLVRVCLSFELLFQNLFFHSSCF